MAVNKNNCPLHRCLLVLIQYALRPRSLARLLSHPPPLGGPVVSPTVAHLSNDLFVCGGAPPVNTQPCTPIPIHLPTHPSIQVHRRVVGETNKVLCTFNNISYCLLINSIGYNSLLLHYLIPFPPTPLNILINSSGLSITVTTIIIIFLVLLILLLQLYWYRLGVCLDCVSAWATQLEWIV